MFYFHSSYFTDGWVREQHRGVDLFTSLGSPADKKVSWGLSYALSVSQWFLTSHSAPVHPILCEGIWRRRATTMSGTNLTKPSLGYGVAQSRTRLKWLSSSSSSSRETSGHCGWRQRHPARSHSHQGSPEWSLFLPPTTASWGWIVFPTHCALKGTSGPGPLLPTYHATCSPSPSPSIHWLQKTTRFSACQGAWEDSATWVWYEQYLTT